MDAVGKSEDVDELPAEGPTDAVVDRINPLNGLVNDVADPFPQGGKQCVHSMGGNWPVGCCPDISTFEHSWKNAAPPWLQRKGH